MFKSIVTVLCISIQIISALTTSLVKLPNGHIQGTEAFTPQNKPYFKFEGIPYAAPPIGELRFKEPQPVKNWNGVLNTTKLTTGCYQIFIHFLEKESEDCLFLNVYTPKKHSRELLPVMFFIHGGGFNFGASFMYGPENFIDNDVILVTINYRLGIFGFLSTEDSNIPGNYGLKDALFALKWTQRNIHLFGGDPNKVTIFGESSGAAAVAYMSLTEQCEGLFRGAIMESGTFLTPGALQRNAKEAAYKTAALLDPSIDSSTDSGTLLTFLQSVEASELNARAEEYFNMSIYDWTDIVPQELKWAPVIEPNIPGSLVTGKMYDLLKNGKVLKVPIMIGVNSEESIFLNLDPERAKKNLEFLDENLHLLVPEDMQITEFESRTQMGRSIRKIYTKGQPFGRNVGNGIRYSSDNYFNRPAIKHAELSSNFVDTYFYQFSYDGKMGSIDNPYNGTDSVGHTEELYYLFCFEQSCSTDQNYPQSDLLTRKRLLKLWTNFAKYLNPTPRRTRLLRNVIWPQVATENGDFLYLDIGNDLEVRNHPKEETYKGWTKLYNSLENYSFDTY